MTKVLEEIRQDALSLPADERKVLARELLGSLASEPDDAAESETAWNEEIARRVQQVNEGGVRGVSAESVHAELFAPRAS